MIFSTMIKTLLLCSLFLTLLAIPSLAQYTNHLLSGQKLAPEEALVEGSYIFVMQKDCNLVLYELQEELWATGTKGQNSGCYLSLDYTGNLAIYNKDNKIVWETHTSSGSNKFSLLVVQKDRNVVLFTETIWGTSTNKYNSNSIIIAGAHNGTVKSLGAEKNKVRKMGKIVEITGYE